MVVEGSNAIFVRASLKVCFQWVLMYNGEAAWFSEVPDEEMPCTRKTNRKYTFGPALTILYPATDMWQFPSIISAIWTTPVGGMM